ncbi:MAG: hypothetical protein ACTSPH_07900 [Promethearchaeota archaeon]
MSSNLSKTERRLLLLLSKTAYNIEEISIILGISLNYAYFLICNLSKKFSVLKRHDINDSRRIYYTIKT